MPKLTAKQQMFVAEYLIDLNATQAAIRAGYSARTAEWQGPQLLVKTHVAEAIQASMTKRAEKLDISAEKVLREISLMAFYDIGELAQAKVEKPEDIANLPEHIRKAIIGWSWDKFGNFVLKLSPKTPSQELIGRHLKLFNLDPAQIGIQTIIVNKIELVPLT